MSSSKKLIIKRYIPSGPLSGPYLVSNTIMDQFAHPGDEIRCLLGGLNIYDDPEYNTFSGINFKWYRCDSFTIDGAELLRDHSNLASGGVNRDDFYTVQSGDVGKYITCITTVTSTSGILVDQPDWYPYTEFPYPDAIRADIIEDGQKSPGYMPVHPRTGTVPTPIILTGNFTNISSYTGQYILQQHDISDNYGTEMDTPSLWDTGNPQSTIDWGFLAVAASYPFPFFENPLIDNRRYNHRPPTLISPSFCVGAAHWYFAGGTGNTQAPGLQMVDARVEFLQPNNTPVTGNYNIPSYFGNIWYVGTPSQDDFVLFKLDNPITGVEPVGILSDVSKIFGATGLLIELDRHLSAHRIITDSGTSDGSLIIEAVNEDVNEGGDSGNPIVILIGNKPVLIGCIHSDTVISNPSYFIDKLTSILAMHGEQLTLYDLP